VNARDANGFAGENLADALLHAGRATPEKTAIRVRGESDRRDVRHDELERDVRGVASALRRAGVVEEQRILLALPDGPELVAAFLGAIWNGSPSCPVTRSRSSTIRGDAVRPASPV
jgi:acyl-CoA synthetase (AMP-forming)/AMP-acid ligase II